MTIHPVPTLDHVVVNVRDRIDWGLETYRRLGFTLTPRGYHTLGSINHLAIFGTEYLELIAAPVEDTRRTDILDAPLGLNGLVFGTEDSGSVYQALTKAGVPVEPPNEFSRPVELPGGERRNAVFRTVRLKPGTTDAGRLYFCHHFTRDLVWRDAWRHHPNGVVGVIRMVIGAREPASLRALFAAMFGEDSISFHEDGFSLRAGLSSIDVMTPDAMVRAFGSAAPESTGRATFMAALTLRTRSLEHAAAALATGGVRTEGMDGHLVVPAGSACGVALEFRE